MNIYKSLFELSKSIRIQNLFQAAKDLHNVRLFSNDCNFSRLQESFLSYLYTIESINKDIIIDSISKKVLDDELYFDSYLLWRRENKHKKDEDKPTKKRDLSLVAGKTIKFPAKEK